MKCSPGAAAVIQIRQSQTNRAMHHVYAFGQYQASILIAIIVASRGMILLSYDSATKEPRRKQDFREDVVLNLHLSGRVYR